MIKKDKALIERLAYSKNHEANLTNYCYIYNGDKSIRWMYESNLKNPTFLNFYSSSTLKSKLIKFSIKLLFKLRLFNIIFAHKIDIEVMKNSMLDQLSSNSDNIYHSIFFGTAGKNKKIVVNINKLNGESSYLKLAISDNSELLINNESMILNTLAKKDLKYAVCPKVLKSKPPLLIEVTNIKPKKQSQPLKLSSIHFNAINEINAINSLSIKLSSLINSYPILSNISEFKKMKPVDSDLCTESINQYVDIAQETIQLLDQEELIECGLAHGDFTPWNIYLNENKSKISIFDWELSGLSLPIFYDIFHYAFQSNVLIKQSQFIDFKLDLLKIFDQINQSKCSKVKIKNLNTNYIFYLLHVSSYYINLYIEQEKLHEQAHWLIQCWIDALSDFNKNNGALNE
jgi:hypothetical protein